MAERSPWDGLHRVWKRQLARAGVAEGSGPPSGEAWAELVDRVNRAYLEADDHRYTLERSLQISSSETEALHARAAADHARLEAVFAAVPQAFLSLDRDGRVEWFNDAAATLFPGLVVGAVPSDAWSIERADGTPIEEWSEPRQEPEARLRRRAGGAVQEVSFTLARTPTGSVCTLTDLEPLKRSQREAREARVEAEVARRSEKARGQFLANMSHELRTPMNAIIGYSEIVLEDLGADHPDARRDLERIHSAGRHLLGLINNVLDLSKIDAGRMDLHLEECDLSALIADCAASSRLLAAKNGNTVTVTVGPEVSDAFTDATRVRQCLLNLLGNAARFTQDGTIALRATREGALVAISVEDDGVGIEPDRQARIFEPFTQAHDDTVKSYGGTGLGLTLTRAFAEMLGGSISLDSLPGRGSTFTLRIPARFEPPTRLDVTGEEWVRGAGDESVLVIDDDPSVFDLVARLLSRDPVKVIGVPTAEQAMGAVVAHRPSVVLLDIWLPGVNGWMALRALRADPRTCTVPVVVVTTADEGRRLAMELHADAFLTKPLDRPRLLGHLQRFVTCIAGRPTPARSA